MPQTQTKVSTNHDEIRRWVEDRGGKPATARRADSDGDAGSLRIVFPGNGSGNDSGLKAITWEQWFAKFEEKQLALLHQDHIPNGEQSSFNQLVSRDHVDAVEIAVGGKGRSASRQDLSRPGTSGKESRNAASTRLNPSRRGAERTAALEGRDGGKRSALPAGREVAAKKNRPALGKSSSTDRATTRGRAFTSREGQLGKDKRKAAE